MIRSISLELHIASLIIKYNRKNDSYLKSDNKSEYNFSGFIRMFYMGIHGISVICITKVQQALIFKDRNIFVQNKKIIERQF